MPLPAIAAARRNMQSDLEAALAGCFAAGVDEVVVCDAHDTGGNIDAAFLPATVRLAAGSPTPYSMMQGIGPGFDAALFVAYHAKAGTPAAVLEHTWTYKVFDATIGGVSLGEFGLGALLAGHFGVPAVYVSGDDKVAAEAKALVPGVVTTVVKHGITRTSATYEPSEKARSEMRSDVERALRGDAPAPLRWSGDPLVLTFTQGAVLRLRRDASGGQTTGRADARDRRRRLRGGLPQLPRVPRPGGQRRRLREGRGGGPGGRGAALPSPQMPWSNGPPSGCSVAGNTSASQAEDRGFESRHPLQSSLPQPLSRPATLLTFVMFT